MMIRCRLNRLLRVCLDAKNPLRRRWAEPHLARCPGCRREHENELALAGALRAGAAAARQPAPPMLTARVRAAVRRASAASAEAKRPAPAWWGLPRMAWATAAAALALLTAGLVWGPQWGGASAGGTEDLEAVAFTRQQAEALLDQVETLPADRVLALAGEVDAPLQRELDALFSDARTALQVVQSCLPTEPVRVLAGTSP